MIKIIKSTILMKADCPAFVRVKNTCGRGGGRRGERGEEQEEKVQSVTFYSPLMYVSLSTHKL